MNSNNLLYAYLQHLCAVMNPTTEHENPSPSLSFSFAVAVFMAMFSAGACLKNTEKPKILLLRKLHRKCFC